MKQVYLSTGLDIVVGSNWYYECSLLPHFLEYYSRLGADRFCFTVNPGLVDGFWDQVEEKCKGYKVELVSTTTEMDAIEKWRAICGNLTGWYVVVCPDEFVEFPQTLPEMVRELQRDNAQTMVGWLADRVSADGRLTEVQPTPSIWQQYPLVTDITGRLIKACTHKITLTKGGLLLDWGGCNVLGGAYFKRSDLVISHFKWTASLMPGLELRVKFYENDVPLWVHDCQVVLNYLKEHGKIVLEHFLTKPGWIPY